MTEDEYDRGSPWALARRIVEAWHGLDDDERTDVAVELAKVLPIAWRGYGPPSTRSEAPDPRRRPAWIEFERPDGSRGIMFGWVPVDAPDGDKRT